MKFQDLQKLTDNLITTKNIQLPVLINEIANESCTIEVEVKQFLPITQKLSLIDMMKTIIVKQEENYSYIDYNYKDLFFDVFLIEFYTSIEVDLENIVNSYDVFVKLNLFEIIKANIPVKEITELNNMLNNFIKMFNEKEKNKTSIGNVLTSFAEKYGDNMNNAMEIIKDYNKQEETKIKKNKEETKKNMTNFIRKKSYQKKNYKNNKYKNNN